MKQKVFSILFLLFITTVVRAQQAEWHPVSVWPFVYEQFQDAVIYTGPMNMIVKAKANIHVANSTLWYESKGKKLEAKAGTVNKVTFSDSVTYYNVSGKLCSVLSEDTINGQVCRLYVAAQLDRVRYEESARISRQNQTMLDCLPAFTDIVNDVANAEGIKDMDLEPLPMRDKFYMLYQGETFEANESNILRHFNTRQERNTYRSFVRSAEILYSSRQSMLTVWKTFFVK